MHPVVAFMSLKCLNHIMHLFLVAFQYIKKISPTLYLMITIDSYLTDTCGVETSLILIVFIDK